MNNPKTNPKTNPNPNPKTNPNPTHKRLKKTVDSYLKSIFYIYE